MKHEASKQKTSGVYLASNQVHESLSESGETQKFMKASELIKRLPEVINDKNTQDVNAIIQYAISEPMYQIVKNGEMSIHEGTNEAANLTIIMADDDLVSLFKGELNPMFAFMSGKIKLKGDMMLAQKLAGFVDQDKITRLA